MLKISEIEDLADYEGAGDLRHAEEIKALKEKRNARRRNLLWFARRGEDSVKARAKGPPVRTLRDMSEAELAGLERQYGCKVRRPAEDESGGGEASAAWKPEPGVGKAVWPRRQRGGGAKATKD